MVDSALSDDRINDHPLATGKGLDKGTGHVDLLDDQGRNIWLEATGSETHDDDTEHEDTEAGGFVGDDWRDGGDDKDDMTEDGNGDGHTDGLVSSPVLVGNPGTEKWYTVYPEGVEGVDTVRGLWSLSKSPGDALGRTTSCASVVVRTRRSIWCREWQCMVHEVRV